jgi:hypothetical protein
MFLFYINNQKKDGYEENIFYLNNSFGAPDAVRM